jgi:predicted PolB exonuclease-like 3'-5' exonuclease
MLAKYEDMADDNNNDYFRKFHCPKGSLIGVALKGVVVSIVFPSLTKIPY